ncbi:MAG: hypothetical protein HY928_06725 [Elusimicrobia bacterium]|nr:hypothetical protein [Elusimicrobiota bacterium]
MRKAFLLLAAAACSATFSQAAADDAPPALLERPAVPTDERIGQLRRISDSQSGNPSLGNAGNAAADAAFAQAQADNAAKASANDMTSANFTISAGDFNLLRNKNGTADVTGGGIKNVNSLAARIVRLAMIVLALLCTLIMAAGGMIMTFTSFNEDAKAKGKTMIFYSLVGLFTALSSYALVVTVGWVLG